MSASRSLARWGIYAFFVGSFTGIFFGPLTGTFLLPFANAFSMILQMAIFPYICISLVLGMGLISSKELFGLFKKGGPLIVALWASAIFFIYFLSQIIPEGVPPLYSADTVHKTKDAFEIILNYLSPENGLNALASNKILAGLSFSLFFGAALNKIEKKELLLPYLERSLQILERIFGWIRLISPLGVFLYISIAFGTIDFGDLLNIKYYLLGRVFICVLFSLVFIPLILSNILTLSLNRIYTAIGKTCFLPFLSGSASLLIPFLVQYRNEGGFGKFDSEKKASFEPELLIAIPLAYCVAQVGTTIVIFLSTFLSFYYRFSVSFLEQILMYFLFMPVSFGDPTTLFTNSFFVSHFNVPITEPQMDTDTGLFIHHFLILMSAVSILAVILFVRLYRNNLKNREFGKEAPQNFCSERATIADSQGASENENSEVKPTPPGVPEERLVLGGGAQSKTDSSSCFGIAHKIRWKRLIASFAAFSLLFIGVIYAAKPFLGMSDYYEGIYQNRKISDVIQNPVKSKVVAIGEGGTLRDPSKSRLQQIIESGILKVGIEEYVIPYSYFNNSKELVGYDIAYAYQLARDLDCSLEFVVADVNKLREQLNAGEFDLGMASFLMTENRLRTMEFTQPSFQQENNVLLVSRSRKGEFMNLKNVQNRKLKILTEGAYSELAQTYFPNAEIVSSHGYSLLKHHEVDACFWTHTSGFVWCILNPEFVVIDYGSALGTSYLAYPIRENSFEFVSFLNNWLQVKEQDGFKAKMIGYWILGQPAEKHRPRWSILKDVIF